MNLLLDTHVFMWYISADPRLPAQFRSAIESPENAVYLSAASIWEAVVKHTLGKLALPSPPGDYLPKQRAAHGIEALAIDEQVMYRLERLPLIHRDPFDRMLVAQALHHDLTLMTLDTHVLAYPVRSFVAP